MARCYPGSVMLEGTTLSEGRGTTRPLEVLGAPDLQIEKLIEKMNALAPQWLKGCRLRPCWFEPTFHKHAGKLCAGLQVHVEDPHYEAAKFRPWRLFALAFKALRALRPDYPLWRDFPYEYETRLAIDVINGGGAAAPVGGRRGRGAGGPRRARRARTKKPGARRARTCCCTASSF